MHSKDRFAKMNGIHQSQSTVQQSYQNHSCKRHKYRMLGIPACENAVAVTTDIQPVFICLAMTDVYIGFPAMRAL